MTEKGAMILLTGGSANGKSTFAVQYCKTLPGQRVFVDTTPPDEGDPRVEALLEVLRREGSYRIISLRELDDFSGADVVVLDCVCKLTAARMFDGEGSGSDPVPAVLRAVQRLRTVSRTLLLITNDVGGDGCSYAPGTAAYVRALGRINAALAAEADCVWEMVCGILLPMKQPHRRERPGDCTRHRENPCSP